MLVEVGSIEGGKKFEARSGIIETLPSEPALAIIVFGNADDGTCSN